MKIPDHKTVESAIARKLRGLSVSSQAGLAAMVNQELEGCRVSPKRARLVALGMDSVDVRVAVRRGPLPKVCPACSSRLKRLFVRNLAGKRVLYKVSCSFCSYEGREDRCAPKQYGFVWKE